MNNVKLLRIKCCFSNFFNNAVIIIMLIIMFNSAVFPIFPIIRWH